MYCVLSDCFLLVCLSVDVAVWESFCSCCFQSAGCFSVGSAFVVGFGSLCSFCCALLLVFLVGFFFVALLSFSLACLRSVFFVVSVLLFFADFPAACLRFSPGLFFCCAWLRLTDLRPHLARVLWFCYLWCWLLLLLIFFSFLRCCCFFAYLFRCFVLFLLFLYVLLSDPCSFSRLRLIYLLISIRIFPRLQSEFWHVA